MPEASGETIAPTLPLGYRLVPPPGWDMVPLRDGTDEAVKRIVDRAVARLSEDIPKDDVIKARLELMKRLNKAAQQARRAGGLTLYLPVERIHGTLIGASIIVSEALSGPGVGIGHGEVVAELLAEGAGSGPVTVDGSDGVRVDKTVAADPEREVEQASRRIDYVLPVPGSPVAQWVTVCFSTIADGDPHSEFADVLVELFDAVMTTFRWSYA
ncbi:hypothetical protein [Streptomyces fructofermentans]|uniref:Uncharacterized protein n=1 Tax=Streptomyces fructofermentans TaxID=152141 RepID=A0A918U377_9ACTN|nr:hypothetical protein [Streptomyces fructofermentans]GGX86888.1 hypothetical protein GCM10010515_62830 [Streptomyces fructofermentans]